MTHITCRLTAKNRVRLRNPMLGNRVWATFTFLYTAGTRQSAASTPFNRAPTHRTPPPRPTTVPSLRRQGPPSAHSLHRRRRSPTATRRLATTTSRRGLCVSLLNSSLNALSIDHCSNSNQWRRQRGGRREASQTANWVDVQKLCNMCSGKSGPKDQVALLLYFAFALVDEVSKL